jgi:hypothetical protein
MANNTPSLEGFQAAKVGDEHLELSLALGIIQKPLEKKYAHNVISIKITKSTIFLKLKQQQKHA